MGIFGKANKRTAQNGATVIAQGTCIIGGISTEGTVHIDGKFEGVILEADVISIGKTDLQEIYDEGKNEEIVCNFCNKKYYFTKDDIGKILKEQK